MKAPFETAWAFPKFDGIGFTAIEEFTKVQ